MYKLTSLRFNTITAYTRLAAVDILIGANALPDDGPRNRVHPGEFNYGGGHVIEELVATAYGTDCYPRRRLETWINIEDLSRLVAGFVLIVDATDNLPTRYLLNKAAIENHIPLVHGAVYGLEGRAMTIILDKTACLRCMYRGLIPRRNSR